MRAFFLILLAATTAQAQFELQDSHTTASLRGIHSLGNGVAWASGSNGTILRTLDDGELWQTCTIPPGAEKLDFRGIQGFDAQTAVVMSSGPGDLSQVYKTSDGCRKWKLIFTNPDKAGFFDAIHFGQYGEGWILGDPVGGKFQVWYTASAGKNWVRVRPKTKGLEADPKLLGAFAASNTALAFDSNGASPLFGTGGIEGAYLYEVAETSVCVDECDDAGSRGDDSWKRTRIPIAAGTDGAGIFSVAIKTCKERSCNGVIVGGDYKKPESAEGTAAFRALTDRQWAAAIALPHGYRSAVAYHPETKTWITVGPNGSDISRDDGKNWQPLKPSSQDQPEADKRWNALSLPFVVGAKGRIGKLRPDALKPGAP